LARGGTSTCIISSSPWQYTMAWIMEQMPQTLSTTWII
jgi:hypothetical protein